MSPRGGMARNHALEIHTVTFCPPESESWLSAARHRDLRIDVASAIANVIGLLDGGGLLVFPAGFLRAPSVEAADALAESMRKLSAASEVALIFGIEIGGEEVWAPLSAPPVNHAFACAHGRPILWPAIQARRDSPAERRVIEIGGLRLGLAIGAEVFNGALRKELERARPDGIVLLTHVGPNERWRIALDGLRAIAPLFIVGDSLEEGEPPWAAPPIGWLRSDGGTTPGVIIHRYQRPREASAERDHQVR